MLGFRIRWGWVWVGSRLAMRDDGGSIYEWSRAVVVRQGTMRMELE
jgi:hypothetical protein